MTQDTARDPEPSPPPGPPAKPAKPQAKADRLAREAAALRGNLRKRKDQARQRADPSEPPEPV